VLKATRREAIAANEPFYFTGRTCLRGHVAKRDAVDGSCYECRLEKQRSRHQIIRATNQKDKGVKS
jgi:hypothetical protein